MFYVWSLYAFPCVENNINQRKVDNNLNAKPYGMNLGFGEVEKLMLKLYTKVCKVSY